MTTKPLVLIVITNADRAGAQKHVLSLVSELEAHFRFLVVVGQEGYLTSELAKLGIQYFSVPSMGRNLNVYNDAVSIFLLRKLIRTNAPHIVHMHSAKAAALGRLATIGLRVAKIYTVHGWAFSPGNSFFKRALAKTIERALKRLTDHHIVVSEFDYVLGRDANCISDMASTLIHNGIKDLSKPINDVEQDISIFSATRFAKQKNIPLMLDVIAELDSKEVVVIAGTGPDEKRIKDLVDQKQIQCELHFVGEVEDVSSYLARAKLYLLTSLWEGLPLSLLEAASVGTPIVATDVGGVSEIVSHGENGFIHSPAERKAIIDSVNKLLSDAAKRQSMGLKSRAVFERKFQMEDMIRKVAKVYSQWTRVET